MTIVWAIGHTIAYPAWPLLKENTKGMLGYSSRAEVAAELGDAKAAQSVFMEKIAAMPLAEIVDPDLILTPLLAFDRFGGRLGQGAPLLSPAKLAILEAIDREGSSGARDADWQNFIETVFPHRSPARAGAEPARRWLQVPDSFFLDEEMVA